MPDYGLTSTGFVPKTLEVILEERGEALRAKYGKSVKLTGDSLIGGYTGIDSEREALLWELGEAIWNSQDPDAATGPALDGVCAITGTERLSPSPSTVQGILTGDDGTVINVDSEGSTESTGTLWTLMEDVTLELADPWTGTTAYALGDIVSNNNRIYVCITAGTSAGSGGPTTQSEDITDNTVHWRWLGEGLAYKEAPFESVDNGEIVAVSGDLNIIENPVSGWLSLNNILDAELGRGEEPDGDLRERREEELAIAGESTPAALKASLLDPENVPNVRSVTIFFNNTDETDADGIPPHSVEAMVRDGDDQDIIDTLGATVAAGIRTHGTETGSWEDPEGTTHTIKFSRPDEIEIYAILNLTYDDGVLDTADKRTAAADEIKLRIVTEGDKQDTGKNAVAGWLLAQAFKTDGVIDNTGLPLIGTAPAPGTSTTIAIDNRELATYDTSRITINWSAGTP